MKKVENEKTIYSPNILIDAQTCNVNEVDK